MQLRHYLAIIRRRWPAVALVVLVAVAGVAFQFLSGPSLYTSTLRVAFSREPIQTVNATSDFRFDDYYRFMATEYVLDDLVQKIQGNIFARSVAVQLTMQGVAGASDGLVMQGLRAQRTHRVVTVEASAERPELAQALAEATAAVLTGEPEAVTFSDGARVRGQVIHIDGGGRRNWTRTAVVLGLQLVIAVVMAIGLAFLLDYLDDRVRHVGDAQRLGLPLLTRIPAGRSAR